MARQSFMQYLIAENQAQEVLPMHYRNMGAAIDAIASAHGYSPEGGEAITIDVDTESDVDYMQPDAELTRVYSVGCYAHIGEVYAWRNNDDGAVFYTVYIIPN
jgi:hypothetical protein